MISKSIMISFEFEILQKKTTKKTKTKTETKKNKKINGNSGRYCKQE